MNFLIDENTVALVKRKNKTVIYYVDKTKVFNISLNKILEYNCNYYGSSLKGRKNSAKKILNIEYKVPIVINEEKNLILIQINSPRNYESLYIISNKIINFFKNSNNLEIICVNDIRFYAKISEFTLEKLIINSIKLTNILNYRKKTKIL